MSLKRKCFTIIVYLSVFIKSFNKMSNFYRPGTYLLNVTWAGRLVKECPLKVVVEAPSNASKVVCSGEGLRAGTLGREIKCYIDTRSAGQDELTIKCEGPQGKKALSELNDHRDGRFTLFIRPQVNIG